MEGWGSSGTLAQDRNAISDGHLSDAPRYGYGSDKSMGHRHGEWRGNESRESTESAFSSTVERLAVPSGAMRLAGGATNGEPNSAEMLDLKALSDHNFLDSVVLSCNQGCHLCMLPVDAPQAWPQCALYCHAR